MSKVLPEHVYLCYNGQLTDKISADFPVTDESISNFYGVSEPLIFLYHLAGCTIKNTIWSVNKSIALPILSNKKPLKVNSIKDLGVGLLLGNGNPPAGSEVIHQPSL